MAGRSKGKTEAGLVTATLEREGAIVVFKRVPAKACDNCGEYYLSDAVTGKLLERAEAAIAGGAEVEIRGYAA